MRTIHTQRHRRLVALIRQERLKRHLNQTVVAKRLGYARPWYSNLEGGGQRRIDVIEYLAIAEAIGFNPLRVLRLVLKANPNHAAPAAKRPIRRRG